MTKDIRLNARIDADLQRKLRELSDTLGINQSAVLTVAINRLHQQEIKTMTAQTQTAEQSVYYIDEQMLGDTATEKDARKMVKLLAKRGYNVEYGHALGQDETTIDDADWAACLDRI